MSFRLVQKSVTLNDLDVVVKSSRSLCHLLMSSCYQCWSRDIFFWDRDICQDTGVKTHYSHNIVKSNVTWPASLNAADCHWFVLDTVRFVQRTWTCRWTKRIPNRSILGTKYMASTESKLRRTRLLCVMDRRSWLTTQLSSIESTLW